MSTIDIARSARKLGTLVLLSARHRVSQRGAALGRIGIYGVLLFVFSRLWAVIGEAYPDTELPAERVLWYIAITEWIVLSLPWVHDEVQTELRAGDLLYRLTRPVAYPWAKLAESTGDLFVRMAVLAPAGFLLAWALQGSIALELRGAAWLVLVAPLAASVANTFGLAIGLVALWIHDCRPIYWVWQKGLFLLGGLLVPLAFYPPWLRGLAELSPFSAILAGPGSLALGDAGVSPGLLVLRLLGWQALALVLVAWLFRRGLRQIDGGGG